MIDKSLINDCVMSSMYFQISCVIDNKYDEYSELYSRGHVNGMLDILLDLGLISDSEHLIYLNKYDSEIMQ